MPSAPIKAQLSKEHEKIRAPFCTIYCHFDQVSNANAWRNLALLIDFSTRLRSVEMTGRRIFCSYQKLQGVTLKGAWQNHAPFCTIYCHFDQVSNANAWRNLALLIDFSARLRSVEMTNRDNGWQLG